QQWCDYDPQKRRFLKEPALPEPKPAAAKTRKSETTVRITQPQTPAPVKAAAGVPANGIELQQRLYNFDATLARQGRCKPGELVKHVVQMGIKAGFDADLAAWSGPA